jgi:hypothetical protein
MTLVSRWVAAFRAAAVAIAVVVPVLAAAQAQAPWFGTWRLDVPRSTYGGPAPYRRGTCVIEPWNGGLKSICDLVRVRGGITHLEWAGRFDGRDAAVHGVEEFVTYAYSQTGERSYEVVIKLDGVAVGRSRVDVSSDGKTMTVVTRQGSAETTSVYVRR